MYVKKPFEYFIYSLYNSYYYLKRLAESLLYNKSLLLPVEWVFPDFPLTTIYTLWKETPCNVLACFNNADTLAVHQSKRLLGSTSVQVQPLRTTHGSRLLYSTGANSTRMTKDELTECLTSTQRTTTICWNTHIQTGQLDIKD